MKSSEINDRLSFATTITRKAGELTLLHYRTKGLAVERKGDGSPVTVADQGAEQLLRKAISREFPNDEIVGEEFGTMPGTSGFQWILDPIDGTKSFVSGVPLYTTLVAVMRQQEPLLGVIYAPAVDEMVYAAIGQGCWHVIDGGEPQRCQVSAVNSLADAIFLSTCIPSFTKDREWDGRPVFDKLAESCRVSRTWGDAFGYLLVATGRAEIMIDPIMNLWDAAALKPVIEEAGGSFFDWQGKATVHGGEAVATNGALAKVVKDILATHIATEIADLG
jgi:histidinol-phosphatase